MSIESLHRRIDTMIAAIEQRQQRGQGRVILCNAATGEPLPGETPLDQGVSYMKRIMLTEIAGKAA